MIWPAPQSGFVAGPAPRATTGTAATARNFVATRRNAARTLTELQAHAGARIPGLPSAPPEHGACTAA